MIKKIVLAICLLCFPLSAFAFGDAKIGQKAPDFSVPTSDGKTAKLSDYTGKFVVLEWYSSVCPCINDHYATGNMQALQKKYEAQGVVWLTVSSHAPDKDGSLTPEMAKSKILGEYKATPTAILLDHDGKMGTDYGAQSTPHIFVINPQGNLIYKGALDNKTADGENYDPLKSRNFLSEALDAALAGRPVAIAVTEPYGCMIKYPVNEYTLKH